MPHRIKKRGFVMMNINRVFVGFGVCVGLFTAVIRCFGGMYEGISFAIILANLLTPLIEKWTYPKPFGVRRGVKKQ